MQIQQANDMLMHRQHTTITYPRVIEQVTSLTITTINLHLTIPLLYLNLICNQGDASDPNISNNIHDEEDD
jgi:hypothetical protein